MSNDKKIKDVEAPEVEIERKDRNWYIIYTHTGHEKKVCNLIKQRAKAVGMSELINEAIVPTQEKIEVNSGKKRTITEKVLPGYVLVQMLLNEESMHVVLNTDGVMNFIGTDKKPTPLSITEVKAILAYSDVSQPTYHASFAVGDAVKVTNGPFKDFVGSVNAINTDKGQVTVLLSVFGRETPVELDFAKVTRLS